MMPLLGLILVNCLLQNPIKPEKELFQEIQEEQGEIECYV